MILTLCLKKTGKIFNSIIMSNFKVTPFLIRNPEIGNILCILKYFYKTFAILRKIPRPLQALLQCTSPLLLVNLPPITLSKHIQGKNTFLEYYIDKSTCDINVKDALGMTPTIHAIFSERMNSLKLLLENGANPLVLDNSK